MEYDSCRKATQGVWFKLLVLLVEVAFSAWALVLWWPCLQDEIVTAVGDPVRCSANALNFVTVIRLLLAAGVLHVILAALVIVGLSRQPEEGGEKWKMLLQSLVLSQVLDFCFDIGTVICFGVVYGNSSTNGFTASMWLFIASNAVSGCFSLYMIYNVYKNNGMGCKDMRLSYFCCGAFLFWLPCINGGDSDSKDNTVAANP